MFKKVIRIAGTSFSGSTMLDLMLANDSLGFSCGEINALFRPYRQHHFKFDCSCGNPECKIWETVKYQGENKLWPALIDLLPEKQFFVDSSKELVWLNDQKKHGLPQGMTAVNILIWKTPLEYALSCYKRGQLAKWYHGYTSYFERYFSIMDQWVSVRFNDLTFNPSKKLKSICKSVGVEYYPGKENYWERKHHTLFGSHSAKLHLYAKNESLYSNIFKSRSDHKTMINIHEAEEVKHHKKIYGIDSSQFNKLPESIRIQIKKDKKLSAINKILNLTEVDNIQGNHNNHAQKYRINNPIPGWYIGGKIKRNVRALGCKFGRK